MSALGRGRVTRTNEATFDQLFSRTDGFGSGMGAKAANDFFFGFTPPIPIQIPYDWLSPPLRARSDAPINDVSVARPGGLTAYQRNDTSVSRFGDFTATYTLDTAIDADLQAFANWVVSYYAISRSRCPSLMINLFGPKRTDADRLRVLGVAIGTRIQITGSPATWPEGIFSLIVEGVTHQFGGNVRTVTWNTSPVIGSVPGTSGPWFRLNGVSQINGADVVPF